MTNNIFKVSTGVLALMGALTLASCSDKEDFPTAGATSTDGPELSLAIKGMPAAPSGATATSAQETSSVFQFGTE